jgi:hypothetical protein
MRLIPQFVSLLLTPILIVGPLSAQTSTNSPAVPSNAAVSQALQLRLVEGESTEVPAGSRALKGFLIEVVDSSGAAVPDAALALRLPDSDPTGTFADGSHSAVAYTDQAGRAKMGGIQWNATPGLVAIRVTASRGTAHAGVLIQQTLAPLSLGTVAAPISQTSADALPPAVASVPLSLPLPFDTQSLAKVIPSTAKVIPSTQSATVAPRFDAPAPVQRNPEPAVSVTSASPGESKHSNKTKWIILLAAVAAGAGIGVAMMGKKSTASAATAPGISIGPPIVSVGAGH